VSRMRRMLIGCESIGKVPVLNEVPCYEDVFGSGRVAPLILHLGSRRR
jgi:hypothetical protein